MGLILNFGPEMARAFIAVSEERSRRIRLRRQRREAYGEMRRALAEQARTRFALAVRRLGA